MLDAIYAAMARLRRFLLYEHANSGNLASRDRGAGVEPHIFRRACRGDLRASRLFIHDLSHIRLLTKANWCPKSVSSSDFCVSFDHNHLGMFHTQSAQTPQQGDPFVCDYCQRSYTRLDHLTRHLRSRSGSHISLNRLWS